MYPASDWSCFAPDHHGYQRACDLINGQASTGPGHQFSHAPGRPNLHLVSSSRRPRQVKRINLATSSLAAHFSASVAVGVESGIKRSCSLPDPSSWPRRPGHAPGRSRRCGRVYWRGRSPARCDEVASWATRPFLTQYNRATLIVAHDVERVLADIDTNHGNCSVQCLGHGVLLILAPLASLSLAGREHGRTIPLTDIRQSQNLS